jgi:LacI family transcriptional regulator, repressor for deo operon, udp, cdd, tsx, nupC, and nupG
VDTPPRRPTIADVARRAGVSAAAVSFAVNDRPGVGPETRARILAAAEELGWRPSASARALSKSRVRAIGLVLAREPAHLEVDAFFVRFLSGLQRALVPRDYALLLQLLPGGEPDPAAYDRLAAQGRVDGLVLTDVELEDPRFERLEASGLPVVVAGRPASACPFPWVETEHAAGMTAAARHLVEAGHERIAFLGGPAAYEHVQVRRRCWEAAVRGAGLEPGPAVHADAAGATEAAARALAARPTAVACTSDSLAMVLVGVARERGLRVPGDVAVTGFDDSPLATLSAPALTSVRVDYAEFGAAAGEALVAAVERRPAPDYRPSPPVLVPRASSAAR